MPHHVVALALPGVVAFDLSTVGQVFGVPEEPEYTFEVAAVEEDDVVTSTGFTIGAVAGLSAFNDADTVVVPGFRPIHTPEASVLSALTSAHQRGARVVSICTGAFALAAAGLLDGLEATTHWLDAPLLEQQHPEIRVKPEVLYVDHGQIATSAGVAAGIDLCLHLVRRDHGQAVATRIARRMVVPPHRAGGQAQYIAPNDDKGNHQFAELSDWILENLHRPITIADLAAKTHVSTRQLARRFVAETGETPHRWILHQRVLSARHLLEASSLTVDEIAVATGLGSASNLRRHFNRAVGVTPSSYRGTFRGA